MLAIGTVLHPTAFSDRSRHALPLACALSRDCRARRVALHVVRPPTIAYGEGVLPPEPEDVLERANAQLHALQVPDVGVRAERRLEEGDPSEVILRVAQEI